jgi:uncharacterized protein (TIGR03083 family)
MSDTLAASPESAQAFAVHIRRETGRFAEVAARSPLQAHVPAYPAFTVETLSAHIGRALRIFPTIIAGGSYRQDEVVEAPTGPAVVEWVEAGLEPLLTVLAEVPPDTLVTLPHGTDKRPVSVIAPLLAVEIGVHRWDVESVLGEHAATPQDLAIREIDSVFENFVPRLASTGVAPIGGAVRLQATDVAVGWRISVEDGRLLTGRLQPDDAAKPDGAVSDDAAVVVTAPVEDLALICLETLAAVTPGSRGLRVGRCAQALPVDRLHTRPADHPGALTARTDQLT